MRSGSTRIDGGGALLERLGRPTTFVVGKGGVGKTTTAGGLALALADAGTGTHLLSTDPAHSLGDLFAQPLPGSPAVSRCTDRLVLEELDAAARARDRLAALEPGLRRIIERGTYLDAEDAASLLDASVPGLDEVGAALRIGELAAAGQRLVVDTAPTGHTLRLLDLEATVRGWIEAFEAMAARADVVASALLGQAVRLEGEADLDRLAAELAAFTAALRAGEFVVVTGAGPLAAIETDRLLGALLGRGLTVAATVAAARPGAAADVVLRVRPGLEGCRALREWWADPSPVDRPPSGPVRPTASVHEPGRAASGAVPPPLDRDLLVFTGKGGVGKTTCAAAMAVRLAAETPVTILGSDPTGSLSDVIAAPVPSLTVVVADPDAELDRFRQRYVEEVRAMFETIGLDRSARLDREVMETLWAAAPPGLDELMAVIRLADDTSPGTRTILDSAATGHFLRLAAMPRLALDWTHRIMRILLKYREVRGLDSSAGPLLRLARRLRALRDRLADPDRTAIVLVTVDEPLVQAETRRLLERLRDLALPPAAIILNRDAGGTAGAGRSAWTGIPVFRAPAVPDPVGPAALRAFAWSWERIA